MHRALPLILFSATLLPKGNALRIQIKEVSVFMTLDEARLMANVNARAQSLFNSGYRARWRGQHALEIRSPKGTVYQVNTLTGACDCPFFQKHAGRYDCKHVLGARRLLSRQRACRRFITTLLLRIWADLEDGSLDGTGVQFYEEERAELDCETEAAHATS